MPATDRLALAKMQTKRYGLVISDWNMEPMTGYDLLKEVRASPEFSKTPFIMITAEIQDRERHCREEGRREQLHRQAVQCRDTEDQDGSGISGFSRLISAGGASTPPGGQRKYFAVAAFCNLLPQKIIFDSPDAGTPARARACSERQRGVFPRQTWPHLRAEIIRK